MIVIVQFDCAHFKIRPEIRFNTFQTCFNHEIRLCPCESCDAAGATCSFHGFPKDAKVAGFLPIDWNQDGAMDLLIGAWGLSHLKLFLAGWCILDYA
jgi:hypothetical protein